MNKLALDTEGADGSLMIRIKPLFFRSLSPTILHKLSNMFPAL